MKKRPTAESDFEVPEYKLDRRGRLIAGAVSTAMFGLLALALASGAGKSTDIDDLDLKSCEFTLLVGRDLRDYSDAVEAAGDLDHGEPVLDISTTDQPGGWQPPKVVIEDVDSAACAGAQQRIQVIAIPGSSGERYVFPGPIDLLPPIPLPEVILS